MAFVLVLVVLLWPTAAHAELQRPGTLPASHSGRPQGRAPRHRLGRIAMEIVAYVAKFLAGGALVCAFALVSEVCAPKRFAGLFSAAPSVLVAGLAVTLLAEGAGKAALTAQGAIAGAVGLIAYCVAAAPFIRRFGALRGAGLAVVLWAAVALAAYGVLGKAVGW